MFHSIANGKLFTKALRFKNIHPHIQEIWKGLWKQTVNLLKPESLHLYFQTGNRYKGFKPKTFLKQKTNRALENFTPRASAAINIPVLRSKVNEAINTKSYRALNAGNSLGSEQIFNIGASLYRTALISRRNSQP